MQITLVVNPSAGKGRAQEVLPQVAGTLRDAGHDLEILLSRDFDEARAMTQRVASAGGDGSVRRVLAVMGGDGMMHLGVNACAQRRDITLGLIPAGTGNDLARGLGIDPHDPAAATRVVAAGNVHQVDLARVADRYIGTVVASGFDALVNSRANQMPWPKGNLRYLLATMAELRVFSPLAYRLVIDGQARELRAMLVAVGNFGSYGGGMRICPDADARDGLLDLTIIHPVRRGTLLRLLPAIYSGRFVRHPCVERRHAREVVVDGPGLVGFGDGEQIGAAPLTVTSVPAALSVLVPNAP